MDLPGQMQSALGSAYRIERPLGRGGMATVYLAHDLRHDRPVALKVLHPELAQTLGPERFDREIKLAARLQHPHILTVLDSGDAAGQLWFTMPYVDGESLRERLTREGQLPVDDAVRITREAAAALDYSHRHGVVHRDIKPENILLTKDGDALVADFGIARALSGGDDAPLTQTGMAVGTPAYMSPEQASGAAVDARTDVYSLGAVLYEMLAGEPPFTGPSAQAIIARRFSEPVRPLRTVRETVPEGLEQAVLRALARAPADRYATASDFSRALGAAAGAPTPGAGVSTQRIDAARGGHAPRLLRMVGFAAVMVLLAAVAWRHWSGARAASDAPPDASAIAVLPFRVAGPGLDLWREGLVDLVSIDLDGAAGRRTIPPRTVLSRWHRDVGTDEADQDRALQVARSLGARYAISGSIVGGTGGLRLSADLIDVTSGAVEARAQVEGSGDSVPSLVDRLAVELLRSGGAGGKGGRVMLDLAGTTTRSLPALKHLLAGEQLFRRGRARDALDEYRAALAADSGFALAAYRLALVDAWTHSPHYLSEIPPDVLAKMVGLVDRLPPREAAIARALPLLADGDFAGLPLLRRVADDNPNDAEAWFQYGDALFHLGGPAGVPRQAFRDALRRSTQLDPGFAPAYIHLAEDAFDALDSAEVLRILTVLRDIDPADARTTGIGLAHSLIWGDSTARAAVTRAVDTAQTLAILTAKHVMDLTPDLAEPTFVFGRALATESRHAAEFRAQGNWGMGYAYRGIGRLRDAMEAMQRGLRAIDVPEPAARVYTAQWDVLDRLQGLADSAHAEAQYRLLAGLPDSLTFGAGTMGRYAASQRRWGDVDRWIARVEREIRRSASDGDSASARRHRLDALVLRAYAAEGRGQEGAVLAELQRSLDAYGAPAGGEWSEAVPMLRLELGRRLLAKGEFQQALRQFDSFDIGAYVFTAAPGLVELYRGQAVEGLGDRAKARDHYARVVRWLGRCDPEFVPVREEGRTALARLTAEPAGTD